MSAKPVDAKPFTVIMNFGQAAVMTWGALSTEGAVRIALWVFVGLYIVSVLAALIFFTGKDQAHA